MTSYIKRSQVRKKILIGWREWVAFPELKINRIKAKVDTGARTSTLHALNISIYKNIYGKIKVRFDVNPEQRNDDYLLSCEADLLEKRAVKNSGGSIEDRYIIKTNLYMAGNSWPVELTLTNRENMGFRLLLGRTALSKKFLISPNKSFLI